MQSKTLVLLALSASAAVASPFHKRGVPELVHRHLHRTGSDGIRPTGTGRPFSHGNETDGTFVPTGADSVLPISQHVTVTVSPLPEESGFSSNALNTFGNVLSSTSCTSTSIVTETSVNLVTVVAKDVQHGQSRSWGASWGSSSAAAATSAAAASSAPASLVSSAAHSSTTLATMTSAAKSSVASASKSTSASGSASTSAPSTGSSGGKRGISFNDASLVSAFGSSVSWAYNWGSSAPANLGVEYVPLMWGQNQVSGFASQVGSATHVLSFNEPDLSSQAALDPATAAKLHIQGMQSLVGKVQIGSPAVTNGDSQSPLMGIPWLNQWFEACAGQCHVDFVAFHWYAAADSFSYFEQHVNDVIAAAAAQGINKVWLTEFAPSGTADAQAAFMKQAVDFLDSTPAVERYAAFMASDGSLLSGSSLNSVGSAYATSS